MKRCGKHFSLFMFEDFFFFFKEELFYSCYLCIVPVDIKYDAFKHTQSKLSLSKLCLDTIKQAPIDSTYG